MIETGEIVSIGRTDMGRQILQVGETIMDGRGILQAVETIMDMVPIITQTITETAIIIHTGAIDQITTAVQTTIVSHKVSIMAISVHGEIISMLRELEPAVNVLKF